MSCDAHFYRIPLPVRWLSLICIMLAILYWDDVGATESTRIVIDPQHLSFPMVIITRTDSPFIGGLDDLHGNKILSNISPEQHSVIRNRWMAVTYEQRVNKVGIISWGGGIIVLSAVIIAVILVWNRRLRREIKRRKQIENSLVESELRFRTLFEQAAVGVAQMESDTGRFVRINQQFCNIVGYSLEELTQKDFMEITHPDDLQEDLDNMKKMLTGHIREYVMEKRYYRKDGSIVWVNLTVSPMWEPGLEPDYHIAIIEDFSDKKKAEEALVESRRRLATLIDNLPGMAYRLSKQDEWQIAFVSDGCRPLTGYRSKDLIGQPVMAYVQVICPEDRQMVRDGIQAAIKTQQSFELIYRIEAIGGAQKWVWEIGQPVMDDQGSVFAIEGFITDITKRVVAEESLNRALMEWQATFDAVNAAIWILDKDQQIVRSNKNVMPLINTPYHEVIGKHCWEVLHKGKKPALKCPLPLARKSLRRETVEQEVQGQWFEIVVDPILDGEGEYIGAVHIATNISNRKRNEMEKEKLHAQLLQSQKMESVGRLAGGVAHDFNNMLSVIIGHAELALDDITLSLPLQQDLKEILNAAQRSTELTRQLLAFARKQAAIPKVLDLNDIVSGMLKMLRRLIGEDIDLVWVPGADLWPVKIDPAQVDQILANLCVNGRDAILGVGKISIETHNKVLDKIYCADYSGFTPGEYVVLSVGDDGQGIERKIQNNIFEPFFTTKEAGRGTGLGLSTVYGIVKQNNGFINVHSEPGQGALFNLFLPRALENTTKQTVAVAASDFSGTETILLVEDERTILKLAKRILQNFGYSVLAARTPAQAIDQVGKHHSPIHLMVTDVVMPEMNGQELRAKISAMVPGVKTLFMSGYTSDVISVHGILEGEVHYIAKPFSVESLGAKVREVLEQP